MTCLGHVVMALPLWLTVNQAVFRDVDVIAVGQEPRPLASFPLVTRLREPWALLV